jgi:predicted nucleic acid-binding protein
LVWGKTLTDTKPLFLLDTGPLISLCAFPQRGYRAYIHVILNYAEVSISDTVTNEILHDPSHPGASIFKPLLDSGKIAALPTPHEPQILDIAYSGRLGSGERGIIHLGLKFQEAITVIDDKDAFQIANRFGLRPVGLQDMLVLLARDYGLSKQTAIDIANTTASRYPAPFLVHTLFMLNEIKNDNHNPN